MIYINLDRSDDRRAHMEAQLSSNGIAFHRLPAVDGATLDPTLQRDLNPRSETASALSSGEIGCYLSHVKAWEMVAEGNAPYVAIVEDDIHLSTDAATFLSDFSWIPDGVELVKFDTSDEPVLVTRRKALSGGQRHLVRCETGLTGAAGYILSRECAGALLRRAKPLTKPLDVAMYDPDLRQSDVETPWQIEPAICVQQCRYDTATFLEKDVSIIDETRVTFRRQAKADRHKRDSIGQKLGREVGRIQRRFKKHLSIAKVRISKRHEAPEWRKVVFRD